MKMPRGVQSKDGDTNVSKNGYHYTRQNGKWRLTHHLIAEKKLGRPLRENELVRFCDSDRTNFEPGNIEVIVRKGSLRGRIAAIEAKIMELEAERQKLLARERELKRTKTD